MLLCLRRYVRYALSPRDLEEVMAVLGMEVDHATVHRWALEILPILAKVFRRRKRSVGLSWRMNEAYIKVRGQSIYLYRAIDRLGHTVDFLLTAMRVYAIARRCFKRTIRLHNLPKKITLDKSSANTAAIHSIVGDSDVEIALDQSKYLNNLVEQDRRAVKRQTRLMLGFKDFHCAAKLIADTETKHVINLGKLEYCKSQVAFPAEQLSSLAL